MAGRSSGGRSSTSRKPSVSIRHNDEKARYEIGAVIDGQFVDFATVDDAVVAQRVEAAAARDEAPDDDDEGADE